MRGRKGHSVTVSPFSLRRSENATLVYMPQYMRCTKQQQGSLPVCLLIATLTPMIWMTFHCPSQLWACNSRGVGQFRYFDQYLYISETVQDKNMVTM